MILRELKKAWEWREARGLFSKSEALRVFHGPGEGGHPLSRVAIDRFGDHYWITLWDTEERLENLSEIEPFLKTKGALSAVTICRPGKGALPKEPQALFGTPPAGPFVVKEGNAQYWIKMQKTLQPGLFLDHARLRAWLRAHGRGLRVLNTFAYSGSLSVAAGLGGATEVTTLDLSKTAITWAKQNWELNSLSAIPARFIAGDVFEWLPRFERKGEKWDCVILDPPSASTGREGRFSTGKDLQKLIGLALSVLQENGILTCSINSAKIARAQFEANVTQTLKKQSKEFRVLERISLPDTFPTPPHVPEARYLKGLILQMSVHVSRQF